MTLQAQNSSRRATSADVARAAGVSRSTVSQILNGAVDRFPEETRHRVVRAAAELEYRPSRAGRALATGLSDLVVVLVPNTTFGRNLQDIVDTIAAAIAPSGAGVVVSFAGSDRRETIAALLDLRPLAVVDFAVLTSEDRGQLEEIGARVLPRPAGGATNPDADPVDIEIGRAQVERLLRSTPRRLVYAGLADARLDPFGPPRLEGIEREAARRRLDAPIVVRVPLDAEGAVAVLSDVRERAGRLPLGIACYNDDVAIAVIAAARSLGLSIPEEVALVGVDASAIGQLVSPRLTTVAVDQAAILRTIIPELPGPSVEPVAEDRPEPSVVVTVIPGETA